MKVTADPAVISQILQIEITGGGGTLTSIDPTFAPTGSEEAAEPTPSTPGVIDNAVNGHQNGLPVFGDWVLSSSLIGISVAALYQFGSKRRKTKWNPWIPLATGFAGYVFYMLPILGIDFAQKGIKDFGTAAILLFTLTGCVLGGVISIIIRGLINSKITTKKPLGSK